jgi:hypothetical protein
MASFKFVRQNSGNANRQYGVHFDRLGAGLGRRKQRTAADMTEIKAGAPRVYPTGTDRKSPVLPGGR